MFKYTTIKSFLTKKQCEEILTFSLNRLTLQKASVTNGQENVRKSKIVFENYRLHFPIIFENLENLLKENINIKGYELDFSELYYQFTEYKLGDYYNWHTDSNKNNENKNRYCSIVIQLTDDYTGGNLELMDENETITFNNGIGNTFIFLSNKLHRVTTIESGVRYSLVGWFALKVIENYKKSLI